MTAPGIYESLITRMLEQRLNEIEGSYYIAKQQLDCAEAAKYLTSFLSSILFIALDSLPNSEDRLSKQIGLSNDLVTWLARYLKNAQFSENLLTSGGDILTALFDKTNPIAADLKAYVGKITPHTGLVQSEIFTGSNAGISLESELKREILSSDKICWLVSFIKWTGIRIFADALQEAAEKELRLRL